MSRRNDDYRLEQEEFEAAETITTTTTNNPTMSGMSGADVDGRPGLLHEIFQYIVQATVYTPIYFVGVAFIAWPFTYVMVTNPQNEISGYTLLAFASWAIIFGQLMALYDFENEKEQSGVAEFLSVIATVLYYNTATVLTIFFALAAEMAIGPEAAVVIALLLPAVDVQSSRLYQFGFAYLVLGGASRLADWIERIYDQIPVKEMLLEFLNILSSVENAVPPVVHYLALNEFTRRRTLR